jgi:hypothetical protein
MKELVYDANINGIPDLKKNLFYALNVILLIGIN